MADKKLLKHNKLTIISSAIGIFETLQVLLLIPFLSVVNSIVNGVDVHVGLITLSKQLELDVMFVATVLTVAGVVISNSIKMILIYLRLEILHGYRKDLTITMINSVNEKLYFSQSSDVTETLHVIFSTEIENYVTNYLLPKSNLAQALVSTFITFVLIFLILPPNILIGVIFIVSVYVLLSFIFNKINKRLGRERIRLNEKRLILANIMSDANYETELFNRRDTLVADATSLLAKYSKVIVKAHFFSQFPKFIIEAISFSLLSILIYSFYSSTDESDALYMLGASGLAFYKAIPALQSVYQNFAGLRFGEPVAQAIENLLRMEEAAGALIDGKVSKITIKNLTLFQDDVKLSENINLQIERGEKIAIIGESGVGKTTLIHALLGLSIRYEGTIEINGVDISKLDFQNYMSKVTFVPNKSINLSDIARVHPQSTEYSNYSTGQIQRNLIDIAMEKECDVVFLDEFTSAQDEKNQQNLLLRVLGRKDVIVISIVHRLESLNYYDQAFKLTRNGLVRVI